MEEYFSPMTTTCIIWPSEKFLYNLRPCMKRPTAIQIIQPSSLNESFLNNVYDYNILLSKLEKFGINNLNALQKKLLISIENNHCEVSIHNTYVDKKF